MPSRVVTKVVSAAAVALIAELTDVVLNKAGLSGGRFRVLRKVLKSGVSAASVVLLGKVLHEADATGADSAGGQRPAPAAGNA